MYHHHSQQQGPPQPSSNRPGPTHHQQQPNQQQQQNRFNYPRPSHLPDKLVSARGSGDIDHCLMDLMHRLNQTLRPNPNRMSRTGGYSTNQLGHQQGMDWSNYPHTSQMFASPPSTVSQLQSSPSAMGNDAWMQAPVGDPPSPQTRGSHGGGNGGGGVDKQALYTPERAESILASLGLSNEDLEFPSQYPEDQLNPENVSFILRFIQRNKSEIQNSAASSSYSQSASLAIHDMLPPPAHSLSSTERLQSPEVPRFHSVPQGAGNVIDYGHASQATDDSSGRETSKPDPASSERKVDVAFPHPPSSISKHEMDMPERLHIRLQPFEPNEHVDLDYCWSSGEVHKNKRLSPVRDFPPLYRSRHPDREYSRDGPKPSPSSETRNDSSSSSRNPVLKLHGHAKVSSKCRSYNKLKKMNKVSTQSTPSSTAACLVYLTGIPTTATEQEVKTWVRDFGKYNNVVLFSGSEADQGQKASVCMEREEDALALAQCSSLSIRDQPITVTLAKKPEADDSTAVSKGTSSQDLSAIGGEDSGNWPEFDKKTSEEEFSSNSTVLITGLPESSWTESDVIKLCQPFGAPSDIILARKIGKALLLMPDAEMAEEMVKNHSVSPMKINNCELKMTNFEQAISLNTPVALYNLLNQSKDTFVVRWDRLLVIRNVPDTPTASSDVQKLVERIGEVHNILVLNHNMIICEMLTIGDVVRIRNHYHRFPCIVQSNPLYFTSWRDPTHQNLVWGPRWLPPWLTASLYSFKESPDDDKDNHTVPTADKEDSVLQENEKCDYLEKLCYSGKVIGFHCKLCDSRIETTDALSIDPIHIDAHLKLKYHKMLSRQNEEYVEEVSKNINVRRFYCHLCKCYMDGLKCKFIHLKETKHIASVMKNSLDKKHARKVKKDMLRDKTGEKTNSKDEAAGKAASKERKSKDQQDIKVGEELSNAASTQVCHPETDAKTDKVKVSLFKQPEETKHMDMPLERLDKETKSSSSVPVDGGVSSSKHAGPPKESPDDDKDNHTVPTADKEDSILQVNEKCDYLEKLCYAGRVIGFHCKLCDSRMETADALSIDPIHIDAHLKGKGHQMLSSQNEEYVEEVNNINVRRFYCHLCKCYMDGLQCKFIHLKETKHIGIARAMKNSLDKKHARKEEKKKGKLRDETGEKTNCKDEAAFPAASKERKGKDQQDIKVGEELSNAGPTQVCHPETDVKTDKVKVSLFKQPEESKHMDMPLEGLDKETSSSAPVDGGVSSSKHAGPPKESPANDKDSHTVPTADKEDSTPQENEKSVPEEKKKAVKVDNRNAEGDAKISGEDEYLEEIPNLNGRVRFHCKLCNGIFFEEAKEEHLKGRRHTISLQLLGQKSESDEYFEEVRDPKGKLVRLHCKLCRCNIQLCNKGNHLKTKTHKRILELKRDFDVKKLKEGELRDDTDEKTSSKDEDQQDIKVGEEPPKKLSRSSICISITDATRILGESPAYDKDSHTVPTADKEDSTPQQNGKYDYLVDICYDGTAIDFFCTLCESRLNSRDAIHVDTHLNGEIHNKLLSLNLYHGEKREDRKIEIFSQDECIVEVDLIMTPHKQFCCSLCKRYINYSRDKYRHLKGKQHIASLWKKLKEGKLKDYTDEKTSSKDEAAGKELSKDQQGIKVGEELSSAAPTQVCNPGADVKTDDAISLQLLVENNKLDEYVEVRNRDGRVVLL